MLDALIAAGTDIFRLNFSHGTHESHGATFARVRAAARARRREVAILQDLGGPKIRTGPLEGGRPIHAEAGRHAARSPPATSSAARAHVDDLRRRSRAACGPAIGCCSPTARVELRVDATDGTEIETTVVEGGELGEHKGINAPGVPLPASAITPKDVDDLQFGLSLGVDMVALSFVQTAADLRQARQLHGRRAARRRAAGRQAGAAAGARTPRRDSRRRATR